jgi:23S rRNA pseudouridine1911/1915/1917 synthase
MSEPAEPEIVPEIVIDAARAERTLADVVRQAHSIPCSWNRARELCKRGKVRLNGELVTDAAVRVRAGDRVNIDLQAPRVRQHVLDESAIIYVDPHVVVVSKPAGLLSVPFDANDKNTLSDRLRFLLRRKYGAQGAELGAVQRLDKDTTGLLVFARTLSAKRQLQQAFRVHAIERRYLALAHGVVSEQHIETQLLRDRGDGLRGSFGRFKAARGPVPTDAKRAVTDVRPLAALRGATLVECQLSTGRQHQIRIHMSEAGHPLLGEEVYIRDYEAPLLPAPRIMLHAAVLGFAHPSTGRALRFELPVPPDFSETRARLTP